MGFLRFNFAFYARRHIRFASFDFFQDTVFFAFSFEAFKGFFEVFGGSYFNENHYVFHHLLQPVDNDKKGFYFLIYIIAYFGAFFASLTCWPQKTSAGHQVEVQMVHALARAFAVVGDEAEILDVKLLGQFLRYQKDFA